MSEKQIMESDDLFKKCSDDNCVICKISPDTLTKLMQGE